MEYDRMMSMNIYDDFRFGQFEFRCCQLLPGDPGLHATSRRKLEK